jgi:hypothetical protein
MIVEIELLDLKVGQPQLRNLSPQRGDLRRDLCGGDDA